MEEMKTLRIGKTTYEIVDAKAREEISKLSGWNENQGSGLTSAVKNALLNCFAHVAWTDENGQSYYDALATALNSSDGGSGGDEGGDEGGSTVVTLTSISAVYGGGEVASGTALSELTDIVVTAHYSDGSTKNITGYELSGEIVAGTNTITVSYGGLTTTFEVVGTESRRTYLTYGERVAMNTTDNNVVKYSDDGATQITYNQKYAHIVVEEVFDHDVDVHFKYRHGGATIWRNLLIASVDVSEGKPSKNVDGTYNFALADKPWNAYNCTGLETYYVEGSGKDYCRQGNVYEGVYTLKAGCMLMFISGSNTATADTENTYFYVEE